MNPGSMRVRYYNHGRRDHPAVALTFDDGPNPPRTDQLLEVLAAKKARASDWKNASGAQGSAGLGGETWLSGPAISVEQHGEK